MPIDQSNDSGEHIILNAIGGIKTVSGFICRSCNSESGSDWDSELASQLNYLGLIFGIARKRGSPPPKAVSTISGERFMMGPGGRLSMMKPVYESALEDGQKKITIKARSPAEAERMLNSLKRKHPNINVNELLNSSKSTNIYPESLLKLNLNFGGAKTGRSLIKSALALVAYCNVDINACKDAISYLRINDAEGCFGFYYERDLVLNRPQNSIFHCVSVFGSAKSGLILAYIEYFSIYRLVARLSSTYSGEDFKGTYAIDPILGRELQLDVDLALSYGEVADSLEYKKFPDRSFAEAVEKVLPMGLEKQFQLDKDESIKRAVSYAFESCGAKQGEMLQPEHISKLIRIMTDELIPFVRHHMIKK